MCFFLFQQALWLLHTGHGNAWRAGKGDTVTNQSFTPMEKSYMIGYRVAFCREASVSAFCVQKPLPRSMRELYIYIYTYVILTISRQLLLLRNSSIYAKKFGKSFTFQTNMRHGL